MKKLVVGQKPKVLVVGAGPIGLAAALEFANFEIDTLVLDKMSKISRASKAICWSQRSLEILNRVGLAEQLIDKGSTLKKGRVFKAEEEIYNFDLQVEVDLSLLLLLIYSNIMLSNF